MYLKRSICPLCGSGNPASAFSLDSRTVSKCRSCSFLFASEYDAKKISDYYLNSYYPSSDAPEISSWININKSVWEQLCKNVEEHAKSSDSILDIGAGTGGFLLEFHRRNPPSKLFATESSKEARDALLAKLPSITFTDNEAIPETQFSIITALQVLEHLESPLDTCRKAFNALEPDGLMMITVPNCRSYEVLTKGKADSLAYGNPTHLQFFSTATVEYMLRKAGFTKFKRLINPGDEKLSFLKARMQYAARYLAVSTELRYIAYK